MLGSDKMQDVRWMQAIDITAANTGALEYLPDGTDIDALSHYELIASAGNVTDATGEPKFGLPADPKGLKHLFFRRYLYPSFVEGVVRTFASDDAVVALEKMRELWAVTASASTNFSIKQKQLLNATLARAIPPQ